MSQSFWEVRGVARFPCDLRYLNPAEECASMTDLERDLTRVLDEHRHESGLHMIGGQRRLVERLVEFFEEGLRKKDSSESSELEH
jgi:hypothetical protein